MNELSATAAVTAMRNGDFKAEDYARALLEKVRELDDLNAFRIVDHEMVLEAARAADKARASGAALGMLHGLPIPVKDSVNTKDLPTSQGTGALRDFRPREDAATLKRLFAQGAILMGKTNLHELSFGWTSNNKIFGPVRNPYHRDRIPGGSSGGSAAAVAARIAPLAIAEDTLGSIRVPAAMCGLAGFRPTFGRYPSAGLMSLTGNKFDQIGPVARCVADLSLFDTGLTGESEQVSASSLKGVRIGISPEYFWTGLDPEVERVSNEALQRLGEAGATLVTAEIPKPAKAAMEIAGIIIAYDTLPALSSFLEDQGTCLSLEQLLEQASEEIVSTLKGFALPPNRPSEAAYESMLAQREDLRQSIRTYFQEHDIVVLAFPPILIAPPRIGEEAEFNIRGQKVSLSLAMSRNISLGSCASMASLVLPAGMTSDGLPVGMEFDALTGNDRQLLALGGLFERALGPIPGPVRRE
jgi:Asp-tRNA(Asn)/Glu-tRNA(Gln) amidotransferase A subunit family amidase